MKKIYYNKLVRDKIPQILESKEVPAKFEKLPAKDFLKALLNKVGEEASALPQIKSKQELVSEIADILEVIEEIKRVKKIKDSEIKIELKKNMDRKGGFKKKLFLVWSGDSGYKSNERRNKK